MADIGLALWEGDGSSLGRSAWQSVDSVLFAGITAERSQPVVQKRQPQLPERRGRAYAAVARMKLQAHWQTDVLAGFAPGTATGVLA